ncbi:cyclopropane-fatty-acyl-phospholipid synthase family protein [Methylocapsa polymorpha]|uniref:Cyclopropane-fatty-acyl-phospholipid synthase family protein n=1 Tax=Methylocapsa polymorpha TaxID=3080828 RepID=A0ABZ0HS19_9HYPH|nr:cyclopropane-fatty-acyl-phospholipid synthase family protein [Methylocapsa sp. RX1]
MDKLFQDFFAGLIKAGSMEIETAEGHRFLVGDGSGEKIALRFNDRTAQIRLMVDPELHFGELFMDERIDVTEGSVYDALLLASENLMRPDIGPLRADGSGWVRLLQQARMGLRRFEQANDALRAKRNVAHHYDLDRGLYALFLDSDLQYSCAYFEADGQSLDEAQLAKKRHIAAKLMPGPGQRILDIGCGFGGMAIYLARYCDASVTGVTLSKAQLGVAKDRAAALGLSAATDFRMLDYREIDGCFNRIVSVGMFEHVGLHHYKSYFQKIAQLLDDDGVALIHTIGRASGPAATQPWIAKYIFPGGYIPGMSEILPAIERTGLFVTDVEVLRLHYADTMKAWREHFLARRDEAKALYDERFCRMWELYLAGSECAFRCEGLVVFQIQLAKKVDAVPLTRDYVGRGEAALRQREQAKASYRMAG